MGIGVGQLKLSGTERKQDLDSACRNICMPGDMARNGVDCRDNICTSSPSSQLSIQLGVAIGESRAYNRNCANIFQVNIGSLYTSKLDHDLD